MVDFAQKIPAANKYDQPYKSGPWQTQPANGSPSIAIISKRRAMPIGFVYDERDANFIASAPDLIMACKSALRLLTGETAPAHHTEICRTLNKAIKKADGDLPVNNK